MRQRKQNEKFVFIAPNKTKYLLKTILYGIDLTDRCKKCFLSHTNENLCEESMDLTGNCDAPPKIFICLKTKKYTHESKT